MKIYIVATRDIKTDTFGVPISVNHVAGAIRAFGDQCQGRANNPNDPLMQHPEDFELYQLATYDDEKGEFTNDKKQLDVGSNYLTKAN